MRLETAAQIQALSCWVTGLERDLEPCRASLDQMVEARCKDVASKTSALMSVLGTHRLDNTDAGIWVQPEEAVPGNITMSVEHAEIQIRSVQRCLLQSRLGIAVPPPLVDHVMRLPSSVNAGAQAVAIRN